jgi:hypothetical protein
VVRLTECGAGVAVAAVEIAAEVVTTVDEKCWQVTGVLRSMAMAAVVVTQLFLLGDGESIRIRQRGTRRAMEAREFMVVCLALRE